MRAGKVDLLTMHSGDITTDLVADGYGVNMRPWTRNELCIVGPPDDPAHIRGMTNGAAALRKIAGAHARFVDFEGIGSRELVHTLWRLADTEPRGDWVLKDNTVSRWNVLQFARTNNAYVVVGYIPAHLGKMYAGGNGNPGQRRPGHAASVHRHGSQSAEISTRQLRRRTGLVRLSAFRPVQNFLLEFGSQTNGPGPLFFPVATTHD